MKKPCPCKIHKALTVLVMDVLPPVAYLAAVALFAFILYQAGKENGRDEQRRAQFNRLVDLARQKATGGVMCDDASSGYRFQCVRVTFVPMCQRALPNSDGSVASMTGPCESMEAPKKP